MGGNDRGVREDNFARVFRAGGGLYVETSVVLIHVEYRTFARYGCSSNTDTVLYLKTAFQIIGAAERMICESTATKHQANGRT